jgi:micrococcal nuclease
MATVGWRRRFLRDIVLRVTGVVVVGALHGGVAAGQTPPCVPGEATETGTVTAVHDGDTVALDDGRIVQLAGVEAPLPPLDRPTDAPWPPSTAARQALEQLVGGRKVALALATAEPDRYGRWRANVYFDGEWVEARLVAAGWARLHWYPSDPACVFSLRYPEAAAREANVGLWRTETYSVLDALDPSLERRNGLYELVQGRIRSVGHGYSMTFLDFGRDYWRDFSIMVPAKVAQRFEGAGLTLDELKGRAVRVRGVIEESGGPAIRLNDPGEIEVLDVDGD